MVERARGHEQQPVFPELTPDSRVIIALRGEISDPIQTVSHKPGSEGQIVTVRVAKDGSGMFGLTDWKDNKEWSGIFHHITLSARYSTYFAQQMARTGHATNPQRILNGMIASHPGRRQWDEAWWYPEAIADAEAKKSISNETLGMQLIQGKVPQDAFELVVALGHNVEGFSVDPSIYDSWDFKLAIYVDHRTTQKYEPLHKRMGDFLFGNFYERGSVTPQLIDHVYAAMGNIIEKQKEYRLGKKGTQAVVLDEADKIVQSLGASSDSQRLTRKDLMRLILQDADTEAALIQAGVDPDRNDETVPMPNWENDLRKEYVVAAQDDIVEEMRLRADSFRQYILTDNTWWSTYVRELYDKRQGVPL